MTFFDHSTLTLSPVPPRAWVYFAYSSPQKKISAESFTFCLPLFVCLGNVDFNSLSKIAGDIKYAEMVHRDITKSNGMKLSQGTLWLNSRRHQRSIKVRNSLPREGVGDSSLGLLTTRLTNHLQILQECEFSIGRATEAFSFWVPQHSILAPHSHLFIQVFIILTTSPLRQGSTIPISQMGS